jgi:argininosuccinate lyase
VTSDDEFGGIAIVLLSPETRVKLLTDTTHKLWGGRFDTPNAADMSAFNDSFCFDCRLADADITGSIAWAAALAQAGLLTDAEHNTLVQGLEQVRREFAEHRFEPQPGDEDIHTAVERRLGELVGTVARKLHTGRSRNDQVATDLRLFCTHATHTLDTRLAQLQHALLEQAEQHTTSLMPGYTHLQRAQPITFAHWCLAYVEMLGRDRARLADALVRLSSLPLGCGALAGNSLGIDRAALAAALGFQHIAANSLDAVSDRDFVAELLFACSLIGVHLSRLAEDLIVYSSTEFGFVELSDAYSTGSSLMPQKKNPDSMELLRGKSGRLTGNLVTLLTVLKGLPLAYNKDLQEDKEPLFDSLDTLDLGLRVGAAAIATMQVNTHRMAAALDDAMLATDLADELVRRGVPFRDAHSSVGRLVRHALAQHVGLKDLPLEKYQALHPDLDSSIFAVFDFANSTAHKNSVGGTAPQRTAEQIALWKQRI